MADKLLMVVDDNGAGKSSQRYDVHKESPLGKEIDLRQWDTLVFKGEHVENEHWWLVEDGNNGQVGYAPCRGVPGGHRRHDRRGRGKRRYQDGTREQCRGKPDWRMDWTEIYHRENGKRNRGRLRWRDLVKDDMARNQMTHQEHVMIRAGTLRRVDAGVR